MAERRGIHRRKDDVSRAETAETVSFLKRWGARLVVSYLILLTVAIVAVGRLQTQTGDLARRLETSNMEACHRLNLVRAGSNTSHYATWQFFRLTAKLVRSSTTRPKPAALAFANTLDSYAADLTWIPLTRSCHAAALGHVEAPRPIRFDVSPPPRSALTVGPGE